MLSSNLANAGHGVTLGGVMQYNGHGGILLDQPDNIIFAHGPGRAINQPGYPVESYSLLFRNKNLNQQFGLSPITALYRGDKKFISNGNSVRLNNPQLLHYPNYNKIQEGGRNGREWVYGIWEGRGGVYNLYDPKGDKWGECVPYYLTGTNRVLRIHSGRNLYSNPLEIFNMNDSETNTIAKEIYKNTAAKGYETYTPVFLNNKEKEYYSPMFFGKYHADSLGIQFHVPYVVNEQGIKQKDINLISNAGHLNGMLNPDDVNFDFTFY